jgi:hypothetical protein
VPFGDERLGGLGFALRALDAERLAPGLVDEGHVTVPVHNLDRIQGVVERRPILGELDAGRLREASLGVLGVRGHLAVLRARLRRAGVAPDDSRDQAQGRQDSKPP